MKARVHKLWMVTMMLLFATLSNAQLSKQSIGQFPQLNGGFEGAVAGEYVGVALVPSTTNSDVASNGLFRITTSNTTSIFFDDMCLYRSNSIDNSAPSAPENVTLTTSSGNILSWVAPATGVDGGGYMVVRSSSPITVNPNQNGIYGVGNIVSPDVTVVYTGTATTFTDPEYTPGDFYVVYAVDKAFNYSPRAEVGGVDVLVTIKDLTNSGINWAGATLIGPWSVFNGTSNAYDASKTNEALFSPPSGGETFEPTSVANVYRMSIPFQGTTEKDCKFAVQTADGRRFGLWSFDASTSTGDVINLQTYKVTQNYTFGTPATAGAIVDDYKLLAIVDGTQANPIRNNKYLSRSNANDGTTGGGGGLIIKGEVTFDGTNATQSIGSATVSDWSAGFIVVDSLADLIVTGGKLTMNNTTSNGTSPVTGQRLIIEKGFNSCGIFALEGGTLNVEFTGSNFMSLYHHSLSADRFTWLGDPNTVTLTSGAAIEGLLYTASSMNDKFTSSPTASLKNILAYGYDEYKRATTPPSFGNGGTAWNTDYPNATNSNLSEVDGIIVAGTTPESELYLHMANNFFFQTSADISTGTGVTTTLCNRKDQYDAAAKYLGKPVLATMEAYGSDVKSLVAAYHSGWNLVANVYHKSYIPTYPGAIAVAAPDGSDNYIYKNLQNITLNTSTQNAQESSFPGSTADDFTIPVLASFFIQTPAPSSSALPGSTSASVIAETGSLSNDNGLIVTSSSGFRSAFSSNQETKLIRVDLLDKNGVRIGQTVLSFADGATPTKDWGLDVPLMGTDGSDIYLPDAMGVAMAINVVGNDPETLFSAPIGVNFANVGEYKFRISELKNILDNGIILKEGSKITEIHEGDLYPFTVTTRGKDETTFSIAKLKQSTGTEEIEIQDKPFVYVENSRIVVDNIQGGSDICVLDMMGRLTAKVTTSGPKYTFPSELKGFYVVQVVQNKHSYVFKVSL